MILIKKYGINKIVVANNHDDLSAHTLTITNNSTLNTVTFSANTSTATTRYFEFEIEFVATKAEQDLSQLKVWIEPGQSILTVDADYSNILFLTFVDEKITFENDNKFIVYGE